MFRQHGHHGLNVRKSRKATQAMTPAVMQALEDRQLLTVVTTTVSDAVASIYRYQKDANNVIGIYQMGNTSVVYIGAIADEDGNAIYTDLPGTQVDAAGNETDYLGGLGGKIGTQTYGDPIAITETMDLNDPAIAQDAKDGPYFNNMLNFGINNEGRIYGINYTSSAAKPNNANLNAAEKNYIEKVQVVQFDNKTGAGTVISHIGEATISSDRLSGIPGLAGTVTDVASSPVNSNLLYVLTDAGGTNLLSVVNIANKFNPIVVASKVMTDSKTSINIAGSKAMAFDASGVLWVFSPDYDNNPDADASDLDAADVKTTTDTDGKTITTRVVNPLDPALIIVNSDPFSLSFGSWSSDYKAASPSVHRLRDNSDKFEKAVDFTSLLWDSSSSRFHAISSAPQELDTGGGGTSEPITYDEYLYIPLAQLTTSTTNYTDITALGTGGGAGGSAGTILEISGMTWSYDLDGNKIIAASAITEDKSSQYFQLIKVAFGATSATMEALNSARPVDEFSAEGLASVQISGNRYVLYTVGADAALYRGSTIFLPVDPEKGASYVKNVSAGAFNPLEPNRYYFVWETSNPDSGGTANGTPPIQYMAYVDLTSGGANLGQTDIQNSLTTVGSITPQDNKENAVYVVDIAFDRYEDETGAHVNMYALNDKTSSISEVLTFDAGKSVTATPTFGDPLPIRVGNDDAKNPSGLAFLGVGSVVRDGQILAAAGPSDTDPEEYLWTTSNSRLIRFKIANTEDDEGNPTSHAGMVWGQLNIDDKTTLAEVGAMSYAPSITDPYTGLPGSLLAVCPGITQTNASYRDHFLNLDTRLRPATLDVYQTCVIDSDENSNIVFVKVVLNQQTQEWETKPGTASAGKLGVTDMRGKDLTVELPSTAGPVWIGMKSGDKATTNAGGLGLYPLDFVYDYKNDLGELPAGFFVLKNPQSQLPMNFGNFIIDGILTGTVNVSGSISMLYTGMNLLGVTAGINGTVDSATTSAPNLIVGGNLNSLLSKTSMGTDKTAYVLVPYLKSSNTITDYCTGLKMQVGGSIGNISAMGDISAAYNVINDPNAFPMSLDYSLIEYETLDETDVKTGILPVGMWQNDDSQANAQRLFPVRKRIADPQIPGNTKIKDVYNVIANWSKTDTTIDPDYFSFSLMAGQKIRVSYTYTDLRSLALYDPDGRQVASTFQYGSSYNTDGSSMAIGDSFVWTADKTGLWCVGAQIGYNSGTMNLTVEVLDDNGLNLAISTIQCANLANWNYEGSAIQVKQGDLGVIEVSGNISLYSYYDSLLTEDGYRQGGYTPNETWVGAVIDIQNGNLRTLIAGDDSIISGAEIHGSVGLIQVNGDLIYNEDLLGYMPRTNDHDPVGVARQVAIDGSFQHVIVTGNLLGCFMSNGPMGVLDVTGSYNVDTTITIPDPEQPDKPLGTYALTGDGSFIYVDADRSGKDGIIDLIHVGGDFGNSSYGGPGISTGRGGNVRYITVDGALYRDTFFGYNNQDDWIDYLPGNVFNVIDDSGTPIKITSTSPTGSGTPGFSVRTYGIRGSGGAVVCNVRTDGGVSVTAKAAAYSSGRAEIGLIEANGSGAAFSTDTNGKPQAPTKANGQLNALFSGNVPIDVYSLTGGNFYTIQNTSQTINKYKQVLEYGEIVNINATSIYSLKLATIGFAKQTTDQIVQDETIRTSTFPFSSQHNLIQAGSFGYISSLGAMGNIYCSGNIYKITPNSDNKKTPTAPKPKLGLPFEGIVAPIFATGQIYDVNVGEGLAPSGSGDFELCGIFANGAINTIRSDGGDNSTNNHGDIRGDIWSNTSINRIYLRNNASLIGCDVMVTTSIQDVLESDTDVLVSDQGYGAAPNLVSIYVQGKPGAKGRVSNGGGGILGCRIYAGKLGSIRVQNGFGILNSVIATRSTGGNTYKIQTDGYGIRDCFVISHNGGGQIVATGNGAQLPATLYSSSVKKSQRFQYDPLTGYQYTKWTDLDLYLGTDSKHTTIANDGNLAGVTRSGVIAGLTLRGDQSLNLVQAWRLTFSDRLSNTYNGSYSLYYNNSSFTINQQIKKISVAENIVDLQITTGRLDFLSVGKDLVSPNITVAGAISNITVGRNILINPNDDQDIIEAIGPNGYINSIKIGGKTDCDVVASVFIKRRIGDKTGAGKFIAPTVTNI